MASVAIHPEVSSALRERGRGGGPVVALETAVLTTGLPRHVVRCTPDDEAPGRQADGPINFETIQRMIGEVRNAGAVPAIVAVHRGVLRIGLSEDELAELAADRGAGKASSARLAAAMSRGENAGTTVSATLLACTLPPMIDAALAPIRVFATGGLGGVHRGWAERPDISADLAQLARSPVCVVCSGAKQILDLPATLEALHTLAIPIAGYGTSWFPQFYSTGEGGLRLSLRLDSPDEVAAWCRMHWEALRAGTATIVAQPVPASLALDGPALEQVIVDVEQSAAAANIQGDSRTPFMLDELARRTSGRSLEANIALLTRNASLAGRIAATLASPSQAAMD